MSQQILTEPTPLSSICLVISDSNGNDPAPLRRFTPKSATRERLLTTLRTARDTDDLSEKRRLQDSVVVENLRLAHSLAGRFRGRGVDYDDLVQVANLGLVKAVQGCDPDQCVDFLQYAVPTILGELKRHFRDYGWSIKPPRRLQELQPRVVASADRLAQQLRRQPTRSELAAELDVSVNELAEAVVAGRGFKTASLEPTADEWLGASDADPSMGRVEDLAVLSTMFKILSQRERSVVVWRFFHGWTQAEIGERLGVSQMQISRTLRNALKKLAEQKWAKEHVSQPDELDDEQIAG